MVHGLDYSGENEVQLLIGKGSIYECWRGVCNGLLYTFLVQTKRSQNTGKEVPLDTRIKLEFSLAERRPHVY